MLSTLLLSLTSLLIQPTGAPQPAPAPALQKQTAAAPKEKHLDYTIDGVKREAILYIPAAAATTPAPIIFAFHGHGGTAAHAARSFGYHKEWPEAITVYMQGLPTPGALTDPKGTRNGWQKHTGDQSDRDLKFFDAVLAALRKDYKVDDARIYCTGHSNGGGFTYLLWSARPEVFAAVAPSSAAPGSLKDATSLKPMPCMHIAGQSDPLVKFSLQERAMDRVRTVDHCAAQGKQWGGDAVPPIKGATALIYDSTSNTPFVSLIHPGGHEFLSIAPPLVVNFFKQHAKPQAATVPAAPSPDGAPKPAGPAAP